MQDEAPAWLRIRTEGEAVGGAQRYSLFRSRCRIAYRSVGELRVERQQFVELPGGVGKGDFAFPFEPCPVFGDFAFGDTAVPFGAFAVTEQVFDRSPAEVGVDEVGIEFDGAVVVFQRPLQFAESEAEAGPVVVDDDVARRVGGYLVVILQGPVVVTRFGAHQRPVEVGYRTGRVELQYPVEIGECGLQVVLPVIGHGPAEVGRYVRRVAPYGRIEIGERFVVPALLHVERTAFEVTARILPIGADGPAEVLVCGDRILQVEVRCAPVGVGVGVALVEAHVHVEVIDGFAVAPREDVRDAPAVIGGRIIGTQFDGFVEVFHRVVVVAEPRTGECTELVGVGVNRIFCECQGEIPFGAQQVVEVILRDTAPEVTFVGVRVGAQQNVERLYRFPVAAVHNHVAAYPHEILFVDLRSGVVCEHAEKE